MKKALSIGLFIGAVGNFLSPGYNGALFEATKMSAGEGQILSAVLFIGAAILWFMPSKPEAD